MSLSRKSFLASMSPLASIGYVNEVEVRLAIEEANDIASELNIGLETLEEISSDAVSLEGYAEQAMSFAGGMNGQSSFIMRTITDNLSARWNVSIDKVAIEAFDDNPEEATKIACEGISSAASAVWDGFIAILKKIREATKDMLAKYLNAGTKLKKSFNAIEDKASDLGDLKEGKEKVTGDFIKTFVINGAFSPEAVMDGAADLGKEVPAMSSSILSTTNETIDISKTVLNKKFDELLAKYKGIGRTKATKREKAKETKIIKAMLPDKVTVDTTACYPRDSYIAFATDPVDGIEIVKYTAGVKLDVAPKDMITLPAGDMSKWITAGLLAAEAMESLRTDWKSAEDATDSLIKGVEEAKKAVDSADKDADKAKLKLVHKQLSQQSKNATSMERAVTDAVKNTATAIYGYVTASIGCYESSK